MYDRVPVGLLAVVRVLREIDRAAVCTYIGIYNVCVLRVRAAAARVFGVYVRTSAELKIIYSSSSSDIAVFSTSCAIEATGVITASPASPGDESRIYHHFALCTICSLQSAVVSLRCKSRTLTTDARRGSLGGGRTKSADCAPAALSFGFRWYYNIGFHRGVRVQVYILSNSSAMYIIINSLFYRLLNAVFCVCY